MLTIFYLENCPYCRQAKRAVEALKEEHEAYGNIRLTWIEESREPDIAEQYDYYYVPSIFRGKEKMYEAHPGESYEECKTQIQKVFDAAQ